MRSTTLAALLLVATSPAGALAQQPAGPAATQRFRTLDQTAVLPALDAVVHNGHAVRILLEAEAAQPTERERALLDGLAWMIRLIDADVALRSIPADAVEMLHELTVPAPDAPLARAAHQVLRSTFARIAEEPGRYFPRNIHGKWQFIAVIRLMHVHQVPLEPFRGFYAGYFPGGTAPYEDTFTGLDFDEALRSNDLVALGNHLTYTSFLHFLLRAYPDTPFDLPADRFPEHLAALSDFSYASAEGDAHGVSELDYFAAHLVMMLTNWGESSMPDSPLLTDLRPYVEQAFERVRRQSDDLVLFAELVEAMRLLGHGGGEAVREGEVLLLAHQKPDGSWGSEEDVSIEVDAYQAFHPTWAAMAALRHVPEEGRR